MKNNSFGLVFQYRKKYYKLMDIQWGNDNSFYFIPLQDNANVGRRLKSSIDKDTGTVSFQLNEVEDGHFPTRKISRHASGVYHIKDVAGKGGQREKDGLRGPSFKSIDAIYAFLHILPQAIDTLKEISDTSPEDLIANLPDEIQPFSIQFAVWDKKIQIEIPYEKEKLLGNGVLVIQREDQEFGLIISFPTIRKTSPDVILKFPVKTAYLIQ